MARFSEDALTEAVISRMDKCDNPRLKQIMAATVRHLHALAREVELTEAEWFQAIQFLTATGQKCDDKRQEFILLSDTLGLSMMVDAINHRKPGGETESTVLGPFFVAGAPDLELGANIAPHAKGGAPTLVSGKVTDGKGKPIAGALLDVWQAGPDGFYDVQKPDSGLDLRGRFRAGADGRYHFRTVKPVSYPVPTDGPVGKLLLALGRHPYRPAHLHFIVSAPGHEPLTTHLFVKGDGYLDSDAVFGVKDSLIVDFKPAAKPGEFTCEYDFVLKAA
jgi:protocatechuate 3,4-dioxygenase beta subunit